MNFLAHIAIAEGLAGQTLLDPMAGAGSILYLTLSPWGCSVVANELEPAWADAAAATWAHLGQRGFDVPLGTATILCGDARTLPARLAAGADAIVTSPPYQDAVQARNRVDHPERTGRANLDGMIRIQGGYDAVLTSPPYGDALHKPGSAQLQRGIAENPRWGKTSMMLNSAYDALVTSPPYSDTIAWQRHGADGGLATMAGSDRWGKESQAVLETIRSGYGARNPAQIGNLAGARYARAMAEVYAACVPLLRPGGRCIVVLKNIVRKGREVDLIGQAQEQLEALGLRYVRTHWRVVRLGAFHAIRRKADPDALIVDREAALVMAKPEAA